MMKNNKNKKNTVADKFKVGGNFIDVYWEKSLTYIKTVIDVVREPVLILDEDLRVMSANDSFYRTFQVNPKDTEKKIVFELGNGQWNIPALRKLLENILPENTYFNGFEVSHDFPTIGRKVMMLNARQIYIKDDNTFPPIILLAMEDITEMMSVAETLAVHMMQTEKKLTEKTDRLENSIQKLQKEIKSFKRKTQKL